MDTAPIQAPQAQNTQDLEIPQAGNVSQPIGDTTLKSVGRTRYFKYDPDTQEIAAEYGFQQLLNPGQESSRWQVEKPYLAFYRQGNQYRIDADRGAFQVEIIGSQKTPAPKDAQLEKNVVIHISPRQGSRITETTIRMDDLTFSGERSEFTTEGPVTIDSSQVRMEGHGLIVVFNAGVGKIEYLQVKDLDFLRLKGFAGSLSPPQSKPAGGADEENRRAPLQAGKRISGGTAEKKEVTPQTGASEPSTAAVKDVKTDSSDFYQCTIRDNVVIQYGDELIVSGADQVNIRNILFSNINDAAAGDGRNEKNPKGKPEKTAASSGNANPEAKQSEAATTETAANESGDIVVSCDGGMIIQPMQSTAQSWDDGPDSNLAFEMSGAPLKIDRIRREANENVPLVHCGELTYKPAEDILRLFTNALWPQILLNTPQSNSRIETSGNVSWDRKSQRANIAGPGKIYIGDAKNPAAQPSEISFKGVMDLLFAQMPDAVTSATIQSINFTGGMDAILRQNGTLKTLADSAFFEFGQSNQLSEAWLDGGVRFESLEGGKSSSQAAAESAVFHFNNNQIAQATLNGGVHFASAAGQMESSNARIEFEPDAGGAMHPKVIQTDDEAILQTASSANGQPSAKFRAKRIEYDLQTGSGLAHGPIQFTYYQAADPKIGATESWIPLTITADRDAQFIADANRAINRIIFNENVVAMRRFETSLCTQQDEFHGDKLVVELARTAADSTDIDSITFSDGKVFGQSIKMRGEEKLFHIRLNCKEMSFTQSGNLVQAMGPGKIELDNSKAQPVKSTRTGINFQGPCVARVRDFETIEWNFSEQKLVADGREETMLAEYWPLENGVVVDEITASSMQLNFEFIKDAAEHIVLNRVFTDKGIHFAKKPGHILVGQTMTYNAVSDVGWLTISGSEANPCFIDGARVPMIRYNVNTGQVETSLSTMPGVISAPK